MYPLSYGDANFFEVPGSNCSEESSSSDPMDCETKPLTTDEEGKEEVEASDSMSWVSTHFLKKRSRDHSCDASEASNPSEFKIKKISPPDQKLAQHLLLPELWRKIFEPLILQKSEIVNLMRVCRLFRSIIQRHPIVGLAHMLVHPSLTIPLESADYPSEKLSDNQKAQLFLREIDSCGSRFLVLVANSFENNQRIRPLLTTMLKIHPYDIKKLTTIDPELKPLCIKKRNEIDKLNKLLKHPGSEWTPWRTKDIDWEEILYTHSSNLNEVTLKRLRTLCLLPLCLEQDHPQRDLIYLVLIKFAIKTSAGSNIKPLFDGPLAEKIKDRGFALQAVKHNIFVLIHLIHHFCDDREFILTVIRQDPSSIRLLEDKITENDWEMIWTVVNHDPDLFERLPKWAINNQKFVLAFLEDYPNFFHLIPARWKNDRFFMKEFRKLIERQKAVTNIEDKGVCKKEVLERLKKEPSIFTTLPIEMREDRDFLLLALEMNDTIFDLIDKKIRSDRDFQLKVITSLRYMYNPAWTKSIFKVILNARKNDAEFLLEAAKANKDKKDRLSPRAILGGSKTLRDSKDFLVKAIKIYPEAYRYASPRLKKDEEFFLEVTLIHPECRMYADPTLIEKHPIEGSLSVAPEFSDDPEVCLLALKKNSADFKRISIRLQHDPLFLLKVIKEMDVFKSDLIPYLPNELRENQEFILKAISYHPQAILIAASQLLHDLKFLQAAFATNPRVAKCLMYSDPNLEKDPIFILASLPYDCEILDIVSQDLQKDVQFMLDAIRINPEAIKYTPLSSQPTFLVRAIQANIDVLAHFPENFRDDADWMLLALDCDITAWKYVGPKLKSFDRFYEKAFPISG